MRLKLSKVILATSLLTNQTNAKDVNKCKEILPKKVMSILENTNKNKKWNYTLKDTTYTFHLSWEGNVYWAYFNINKGITGTFNCNLEKNK